MDTTRTAALTAILTRAPVVPVMVIERLEDALPLARALVAGGLPVLEITLRTPVALDALGRIAAEVEGAVPGVGTVLDAAQFAAAERAGARFAVSPGATDRLCAAAADSPLPWLPGAATVSEAMRLREAGVTIQKFFPAEAAGGAPMLASMAPVLADVRFCPTGGLTPENAVRYLALPNVIAIGASWVAPKTAVAAGDFATIERLARAAAALRGT